MSAKGPDRASASIRTDWETPEPVYAALDAQFHFDFDAAASTENARCAEFATATGVHTKDGIDPSLDGLTCSWQGRRVWANPPYGPGLDAWVRKMVEEKNRARVIVALLPANTDTRWFHDLVMPTAWEVWAVRGRINFRGSTSSNTGGSLIVIWRPHVNRDGGSQMLRSWHWSDSRWWRPGGRG